MTLLWVKLKVMKYSDDKELLESLALDEGEGIDTGEGKV